MANGIQLSTNFDLKSTLPLDDRLVVSNINDLNNLDNRYVGLTVYVTGENKYYYYDTMNSWVEFGSFQLPDTIVYESGIGLSVSENETVYIPPFNGINTLNCQVVLLYISSSGLLRLPTGIHNLYNDQEERLNIRFTGPNMAGGTFYIQDAMYSFINGQLTNIGWRNIYETKVIPYSNVINLYRRGNNTAWLFSKNNFVADLENQTQYFVNNTGNQSISGIKKFENNIIFGNGSGISNQNVGLDLGFKINIPSDSGGAISFMRGGNIPLPHSYGIVFEGGSILNKKGYLTAGSATAASSYNYATLDWVNRILSGQWKTNSRLLVNNIPVVLETVNIDNLTGDFIFDSSFNSKLLTINATQNITGLVPTGLQTGYNVSFVQMGNGQLFITGSGGAIVRQRLDLYNTAGQYGIASLLHHSGDQFILYGDLI